MQLVSWNSHELDLRSSLLWISLGTLCRIGELLQAEWKNVDLDQQTWFLPSENVKGIRGKKQDHHVFLSPFALHFFQELKTLTGDSRWCFPNKQDNGHVAVEMVPDGPMPSAP